MNSKSLFLLFVVIALTGFGYFLFEKQNSHSKWNLEIGKSTISWTNFEWTNETLSGRYFEKTAMLIPCQIKGISNPVTLQFDLGSDITGLYEYSLQSLFPSNQELEGRIGSTRALPRFWEARKVFDDIELQFGDYKASNERSFLFENYGESIMSINPDDTIHLGTVGRDLFNDKILVIDYPNKRFAICSEIPQEYSFNLINIEIDSYGRVILPMQLNGKNYRILFDNGSSIFPLITKAENISNFSFSPDIDTIMISSWGQTHGVTGRMIEDTVTLAGIDFSNIKVYANHTGLGIDNDTDGMAGNALFWDRTIIIDFKNRKFGVKSN